ncbi:EamA family transporter, partial [Pectobacterium brasiliense]
GLLLLLFTRRFPARRDWWRVLVLSALNIGVFQALLFVAAYRLPGGLAAVLGAIQPLLVMVLVWAVDHRAPRLATLWSAIVGVAGMAILLLSPQTTFEPVGIAAALLGAVCMATGVWLTRRWQLDLPVLPLTGWQLFLGGLMLAPVAWQADAPLPALTLPQWAAYSYLCLAGAVLAYGLWFRGVSRLPTVAVASLGLLSPLTAVVLGWALLSQSMTGTAFLGLAIVLASVFAVQWTTARGK